MSAALPPYYFRIRENGAAVYRVAEDPRDGRIAMEQIAVVNARSGEVRAQGGRDLSEADHTAIAGWIADRAGILAARRLEDVGRLVEQLNLTAGWAQGKASAAELDAVTGDLLMAMHDLRTVLVRRQAGREAGEG